MSEKRGRTGAAHRRREHPMSEAKNVAPAVEDSLVEEDLLVEEVSIDGMCGVY
ncbi:hypothetical protein AMETH_4937 [Amycolatopsis methanolica 239]|uniref:Mycofactocin n=2 Tax=Amycolatopsis methanolica group TaxID=2893674 RepID=A0A076MWA7_AMYME|nr:hypothetical protein AMETH_4937 [Amycolatopsis methanolica 239]